MVNLFPDEDFEGKTAKRKHPLRVRDVKILYPVVVWVGVLVTLEAKENLDVILFHGWMIFKVMK